jgi:hypothetical protein
MAKAKSSTTVPQGTTLNYHVTVYCHLAQINAAVSFDTPEDLDSYLKDILLNGYADNKPGKTTIYPAHTITKIEVAVQ